MGSVPAGHYGRVLLAWLGAVLVPVFGLVLAYSAALSHRCGPGRVDCSWGLDVLLLIPLALVVGLTVGPLAVYVTLRLSGDRRRAARTAAFAAALVIPSLVLGGVGLLVAPPLGGRYLALRGGDGPAP